MRLTLRTLLAYMDEILEPSDREELAKKVESSEFAHDLIHRTKDMMRRLRLSAPQVVGTGIGLDPNTVAEYLDNVLPPDSVADFERICLESDVHLAEVASAHHVLTMVLGEPAEVDPAARQRMYSLPAEAEQRKHLRVEAAHTVTPPIQDYAAVTPPPHVFPPSAAATLAPASFARPAHDAVPDYLRATSWTRHGTLIAACAAVLLLALSWMLYTSINGWVGSPKQVAVAPSTAVAPTTDDASEPEPPATPPLQPPAIPSPNENQADANQAPAKTAAESAPPVVEPAEQSAPAMTAMAAPPRMQVPAMNSTTPPAAVAEFVSAAPTEPPPAVVAVDESAYGYGDEPAAIPAEPDTTAPAEISPAAATANIAPGTGEMASAEPAAPAIPTTPPQTENVAAPPVAAPDAGALAASATAVPPVAEPVATGPVASETTVEPAESSTEPVEVGTYLDGRNVLLRFDPQAGAWFRLTPRSALHAGDRLLALPAFFPKLTLASGIHVKLTGGTMITLGREAASATEPAISVDYGKVVVVNTANGESNLKLTIGGETADVRLGRSATLAVDVVPKFIPGQDPRKSPSNIMADVYTRDGDIAWTAASGTNNIVAPAHWNIEGGVATAVAGDVTFPDWIDQEPVEQKSEQLFGAPAVETALDPTRPVEDQLLELYQSSRRREVKSLVARSSVYAGLFVPFIEALRDSDQKSAWKMHIDTLRLAMSLGPDSAQKIYETLEDQRGRAAAGDLYQMLCGYDASEIGEPEQFRDGLGTQLVDWMENDSLDYRVLAVQDMAEITGMRLMPNPAGAPTERARGIRLWRQRLKSGEVAPVAR